jgi:hypothetical protein
LARQAFGLSQAPGEIGMRSDERKLGILRGAPHDPDHGSMQRFGGRAILRQAPVERPFRDPGGMFKDTAEPGKEVRTRERANVHLGL